MISSINTISMNAMQVFPVQVEVSLLNGQMFTQVVGLADNTAKESKDRIRSALTHCGFNYPMKTTVINLAPNDRPKEGGFTEFAMAAAILIASDQLHNTFENAILLGSLSLDGRIQAPKSMLAAALYAANNFKGAAILVPAESSSSLKNIPGGSFYPIRSIADLVRFQAGKIKPLVAVPYVPTKRNYGLGFEHIIGLNHAKKALVYSAIGRHHSVLIGEPGSGKSMLAKAFETILPPLSLRDSLAGTQIYSAAGLENHSLVSKAPFRSPHHTTSDVAIVGGGSYPTPGEITLAHKGVLFFDELLEFKNASLQALREPLQDRKITISRSKKAMTFPADFIFLAATNPCRCGYFLTKSECKCKGTIITNLFRKVLGPFIDRVAIQVVMQNELKLSTLRTGENKSSAEMRKEVVAARTRMLKRNQGLNNAELPFHKIQEVLVQIRGIENFLKESSEKLGLTHRSLMNSIRVAFSVMDYSGESKLEKKHIEAALSLQCFHRYRKALPHVA